MTFLQPFTGSSTGVAVSRQDHRALNRIDSGQVVRRARIDAEAEIVSDKADALGQVTGRAMQTVALISQMEQQLALSVPSASGRLAAIADTSALCFTSIVSDTACKLRRL